MDGKPITGSGLAGILARLELNGDAIRAYGWHTCAKEGPCTNASKDYIDGIGVLSACPWALLRDPVWRASVELWRFSEIGALPDLMHAFTAPVAWGVLAFKDALAAWQRERQAEAQREWQAAHGG